MSGTLPLRFKKLSEDAITPTRGTPKSAGFDIYSAKQVIIKKSWTDLVPTQIAVEIPEGYYGQLLSRSSIDLLQIHLKAGTIDSDYRGEVKLILHNASPLNYVVKKGDKIAQLIIIEIPNVELIEVDELTPTERGEDGFGSTGT